MKGVTTKKCKLVNTSGFDKKTNGVLMEIASVRDNWSQFLDNSQVYLTTVKPGFKKGFHLHKLKTNQVTCIKGRIVLGVWDGKRIKEYKMNAKEPITVKIPKKHALAFYNPSKVEEAYIINLCSPPYDPEVREQEDLALPWKVK